MSETNPKTQVNPTRLQEAVFPRPENPVRLTGDPDFAPELLPSEAETVREYVREKKPPKPQVPLFDKRLRPWGSLIVAIWVGALTAVVVIRRRRQRKTRG